MKIRDATISVMPYKYNKWKSYTRCIPAKIIMKKSNDMEPDGEWSPISA